MSFLDIIIIVILAWGAYNGWVTGFIKQLVSFFGFLIGLFIANQFYASFGDLLVKYIGTGHTVAHLLAFIILWIIVPMILTVIFGYPSKWIRGTIVGKFNNILGLVMGIMKYLVLLYCIFNVMSLLGMVSKEKAEASLLYKPVAHSFDFVLSSSDKTTSDTSDKKQIKDK